jgi:hypothetical protein
LQFFPLCHMHRKYAELLPEHKKCIKLIASVFSY